MKLLKANITNFRLLKDLSLNFSTSPSKPLTVIRAANETGKTTCLNALTWCLYGSKSLPNNGNYVLYPSDESTSINKKIEISVEIEFEFEHLIRLRADQINPVKSIYRMKRVCLEEPPTGGKVNRNSESVDLWKVTSRGTERVLDSEVPDVIQKALPESLKDVYFTDGDSAMSFIEAGATQGVKRKRVTNAIESLLGLTVLDNTVRHLGSIVNRFSREIDDKDYKTELDVLSDRIVWDEEELDENQEIVDESSLNIEQLNKEIKIKEKEVEEALKLGDKEKLVNKRNKLKDDASRTERAIAGSYKRIMGIISSDYLSKALVGEHIEKAKNILNNMNADKQLPQVNIPILEELLDRDECFCGTDLRPTTSEGVESRRRVEETIQLSRESDRIQIALSSLFYSIRSVNTEEAGKFWLEGYSGAYSEFHHNLKMLSDFQNELEELEDTIAKIDDTQLQKYREQLDKLNRSLHHSIAQQSTSSSRVENLRVKLSEARSDLNKIKSKMGKKGNTTINWDIAELCKKVFENVIGVLRQEELEKVSLEMNRIFLAMIGADASNPEFGLIQEAALTKEFDIVVYGPNKRLLNPDQDLNGASRRAITLAFILALTKVSEVEAPNIIDTPLGMMSGYVKQSVLLRTIEEGSQIVLFLTHDEIRGVENIIDMYADVVFTITSSVHYPEMLVHKPLENTTGVVRCDCNHRNFCNVCERKDAEVA